MCECSKPLGTVDKTRNRVMIKLYGKGGKVLTGPPRTTLAEAEEDLHALRALPKMNMSQFVERLKAGMPREVAFSSLAGTNIPLKRRRLDTLDLSPMPSQGRVGWTPVKPAEGGDTSA